MGGNVTRAPRSQAVPVEDPAITQVRGMRTGRILDVQRFVREFRYDRIVPVRKLLKRAAASGAPRLVCATCGTTVFLICSTRKRLSFRHAHEDGSCPAVTRLAFSEADIRAMKYRGAQESDAHRRIKGLLLRSLAADRRFADVMEEKTWRASEGLQGLRRPDVSGRVDALRVAFEVQLSTTFLDVVIGRQEFYRAEKAALIWILPHFHPGYRRMTDDDILFGNDSNILVVDEESTLASEAQGCLVLRCWHRKPRLDGDVIVDDWVERLVAWDEIRIDVERQTATAFGFAEAETALEDALRIRRERADTEARALRERQEREAEEQLRSEVFELALAKPSDGEFLESHRRWQGLNYRLWAYGAGLEDGSSSLDVPIRMVHLIESARTGRPVGFRFKSLIQIGHHLLHQHPGLLLGFGYLMRAFETREIFVGEDFTGNWERKMQKLRSKLKHEDRFRLPPDQAELFAFLSKGRCLA